MMICCKNQHRGRGERCVVAARMGRQFTGSHIFRKVAVGGGVQLPQHIIPSRPFGYDQV